MPSSMIPGLNPAVDYTARTFDVILQRALDLLKARVGSFRYGSFLATDIAPAILSVLAWMHEQNAHYYDRRHRQCILELADTPEAMSILTLAQGYRMRPASAASVAVQAAVTPPQPVPITLRKGTRVTASGLNFEIGADTVIPAGAGFWPDGTTDDLIVLVEGTTRAETFTSDGSPFQSFTLGQPNAIADSVEVVILSETWQEAASLVFVEGEQRGRDTYTGDGSDGQVYALTLLSALIDVNDEDAPVVIVTPAGQTQAQASKWAQVAIFTGAPKEYVLTQGVDGVTRVTFGAAAAGSAPGLGDTIDILYLIAGAQKRYQLTFDPQNRGTVRFGNGSMGVIPTAGATIAVSYRTGGGLAGNVLAGAVDTVVQGFLPNGGKTGVTISNAEAGSGGEEPETVDHARFFAPKVATANRRAVRREDWTALAATYSDPLYGAPAHASAMLKQRIPELNTVQVAVWGRDQNGRLTTAGSPLKQGIRNFLNSRRTFATSVEMKDGRVAVVDIDADITLQTGKIRQVVFADVTRAIQNFFNSAEVLPGLDLAISKLYAAIQDAPGVEHATIRHISVSTRQTITLGVGDGTTSLYSGDFVLEDGTTIVPFSVVASDTIQQAVDDGAGGFTGDIDPTLSPGMTGDTFEYVSGRFSVKFKNPPLIGKPVTIESRQQLFAAIVEDLGHSDGFINSVDGATDYFPILRRGPRGVWAGDMHKVVDSFQVAATAQMRGSLPPGIVPGTLTFTDNTGVPQVVQDTGGTGVLFQGLVPVGTVSYSTGVIAFTWLAVPVKNIRATWTTKTVDFFVASDLLPLTPGRLFFWGGFDVDGAQPGAPLIAYDDGTGLIAGNVLVGGFIVYETGHVHFEWNIDPPPGPAGGALVTATFSQARDGVRRTFDFTTGSNLSRTGLDGEGRLRFQFSDTSLPGVVFEDAFDNWQGGIHGQSIDREGDNSINYTTGVGRVTFLVAPAVGAAGTFKIRITDVAVMLYSAFVFSVKSPTTPGFDAGLFADNRGRFWGPPSSGPVNIYPTDQLDHLRGRYHAQLASGLIALGRPMQLSYDAVLSVPPALDITIAGDQIAAPGRISLTEKQPEIFASVGG